MSRKIWGDTDYYTTYDLIKNERKSADTYEYKVNKVTNDLFTEGGYPIEGTTTIKTELWKVINVGFDKYEIDPNYPKKKVQFYYPELNEYLGYDNSGYIIIDYTPHEVWNLFMEEHTDERLTLEYKKMALVSLLRTAYPDTQDNGPYKFIFKDGIYFLRNDFRKINSYLEENIIPVENLDFDYSYTQLKKIISVLGNPEKYVRVETLDLLDVDFERPVRLVYTYTRTYDNWFGYQYEPNRKDRFTSAYQYKKSDGTTIDLVRIEPWKLNDEEVSSYEVIINAVTDIIQNLKEEFANGITTTDNTQISLFNNQIVSALVTAGLIQLKNDTRAIYENTEWCLRGELQKIITKLDNFKSSIDIIKSVIDTDSGNYIENANLVLFPFIQSIFGNYETNLNTLKDNIMSENNGVILWYSDQRTAEARKERWKGIMNLLDFGVVSLAVDYKEKFDEGYKNLIKPLEDNDTEHLIIVNGSEVGPGSVQINYDDTTEKYTLGDGDDTICLIASCRLESNYILNIMQYWYYLVQNYKGELNGITHDPQELFASVFDLHIALPYNYADLNTNILMFLVEDVRQIIGNYTEEYSYSNQKDLYEKCCTTEFTDFEYITAYDALWELFTKPDTINRYLASKARLYVYSDTNSVVQTMRNYSFIPGLPRYSPSLDASTAGSIEIYLSETPLLEPKSDYTNLDMIKIVPSDTYNDLDTGNKWFLKDKQISEITEDTVTINGKVWYKVYLMIFSDYNGEEVEEPVIVPHLHFDCSHFIYSEAPQVDDLSNMDSTQYAEYINIVNAKQLFMALELSKIADKCTTFLANYSQAQGDDDDDGISDKKVYQVECYDRTELERFCTYKDAFLTFENNLISGIESSLWFIQGLNNSQDKQEFVTKMTAGRLEYDTTENTVKKSSIISDIEYYSRVLVKKSNSQYSYYTYDNGQTISSSLDASYWRYKAWVNFNTELTKYIDNLKQFLPYISDIQIYEKYKDYFEYIYTWTKDNDTGVIMSHFKSDEDEDNALKDWINENNITVQGYQIN